MNETDPADAAVLTLRHAAPADAAEIAGMSSAFRRELGEPDGHLNEAAVRRDGFGESPEFEVLIAEFSGTVVGYALFFRSYEPTYAEAGYYLADLYVKPQARRRGVARALVSAVAAHTHQRGRTFVWWIAMADNENATAFYRSLGVSAVSATAYAATRFSTFDQLTREALPLASASH